MPFWVNLLVYAILFVITDLLKPKPDIEDAKPAGLGDLRLPTATEGRPIPLIWGTVRIESPNVVWYGDLVEEPIKQKVQYSIFKSTTVIQGFRYYVGIQQALCMGPVDELRRVWISDDLVIDATAAPITHGDTFTVNEPNLFGGEESGQGGVVGTLEFFSGTNNQSPSLYLSTFPVTSFVLSDGGTGYQKGDVLTEAGNGTASTRATFTVLEVGGDPMTSFGPISAIALTDGGKYTIASSNNPVPLTGGSGSNATATVTFGEGFQIVDDATPAYRDICYVCPFEEPTQVGKSQNIKPWKWEVRRIPNGLGLSAANATIDGGANPANVIYEVLTSADWGYGIPTADVDTTTFTAAGITLATEGNGFSFILDRFEDAGEMVRRVEEQIDALVFLDPLDSKWKIKLARDDYDINTVPEVNSTNMLNLQRFTRASWEGTTNQVRIPFNDSNDDYKDTFGFAQDMANVRILGANVSVSRSYPGVKTAALANALAWRELRTLATPIAHATVVVDRSLYGVLPGDVIGFTDADLGFTRLPMRVKEADYGSLLEGQITLELVQDIFYAAAGTFGDSPGTNWEEPTDVLVPYPALEQIAFEAPRALTARDPLTLDPTTDKVFATVRQQTTESSYQMWERHATGTPTGAYTQIAETFAPFALMGQLSAALSISATNPLTSVTLLSSPDTQAAILAAFPTIADADEAGIDLSTLMLIGNEFILALSAQASSGNVQLNNVYRGVLDSVQEDHPAGAPVYLIFVGAGISDSTLPPGDTVDIKLLPRAFGVVLDIDDATAIQFTMANRTRSPYPPAAFDINSTTLDTTNVDLDASGTGEDVGVLIDNVIRRDFRTLNEVESLSADASTLGDGDFPTAQSTTIELQAATTGGTQLTTTTGISGQSGTIRQLDILEGLGNVSLPSSLVFGVRQEHTFNGSSYTSAWFDVTATIVSDMIGKHAFGALDQGDISTQYTVQTGDGGTDHIATLSTAFTVGDVEYRINGGTWTTLIAAGGTGPGTIPNASISDGDTIEIRHLSTDTNPQKLLRMTVSATVEAYAVLIS